MKKTLLIFSLLSAQSLFANDICNETMRAFFNHQDGKVISNKTAAMDITKYGLNESLENRQKFEHLYSQCLAPGKNKYKNLATKRFATALKTMDYATSIIGYTQSNWNKPKDKEWFEKLGYGLVFGAICGKIAKNIVKDNGNRFGYLVKEYLYGRGTTILYFGGSNVIFGEDKENQKKLEKLKAYADNDDMVDRYTKELVAYLSHLEVIDLGIGVHQGVDFDHLKPSDLDDKDIQKVVIASILSQEYQQQKGPMSFTNSKTQDFFMFDSIYSMVKIPKDIFVNKMINQVLCLNTNNMTRGMTQAVGITAINQILFADYYGVTYKVGKKILINQ